MSNDLWTGWLIGYAWFCGTQQGFGEIRRVTKADSFTLYDINSVREKIIEGNENKVGFSYAIISVSNLGKMKREELLGEGK